jgi:hypothetical protein
MGRPGIEVHGGKLCAGSGLDGSVGDGSALALRRILFMYAGLRAAALLRLRDLTLVAVPLGGVPHSLRRRAFFHACARSVREPRREPTRIRVR